MHGYLSSLFDSAVRLESVFSSVRGGASNCEDVLELPALMQSLDLMC